MGYKIATLVWFVSLVWFGVLAVTSMLGRLDQFDRESVMTVMACTVLFHGITARWCAAEGVVVERAKHAEDMSDAVDSLDDASAAMTAQTAIVTQMIGQAALARVPVTPTPVLEQGYDGAALMQAALLTLEKRLAAVEANGAVDARLSGANE